MNTQTEAAPSPRPQAETPGARPGPTPRDIEPPISQLALPRRELSVDVDSLLAGEFEPLEFARELDTQFELILDINKALETDLGRAKEELQELKRRGTQIKNLVHRAVNELKHGQRLNEQVAGARADYEAVLEQIDRTRQDNERQDLIIEKKDEKIVRLNEALNRLKYEASVLKNKIDGIRAERAELENQLQTVYFDLRELQEQKKAVEQAINTIRRKTKAAQESIMKIKRTVSNVLAAFANTQAKARLRFGKIKVVEQ